MAGSKVLDINLNQEMSVTSANMDGRLITLNPPPGGDIDRN
jgi:hypothetical protein